jgi:outer membrane protein insertion porin family
MAVLRHTVRLPRAPHCWTAVACALLVVVATATRAHAQTAPVVTAVVIEQEGVRLTDPDLAALVETTVGEPLDPRLVRETIAHFMSLGRLEDVQAFQETGPGGMVLRYVLQPLHPIDRIEFRGTLGVAEADLRRAVVERFGAAPAAGRIDEVRRSLDTFYRGRGFPEARVTARVEESHNPDRASLVFAVEAGPRARIGILEIDSPAAVDRQDLLASLGVRVGGAYDSEVIQRGLDRYEANLRARGYYEARATHSVRFDADGSARVVLVVDRGPLVTLAFSGDPLTESERVRLVPVRAEGSVDEDLLEDSALAIEEYLRSRGYRDGTARYTRMLDGDQLLITFTVTRGRRYLIDAVRVQGNRAVPQADLVAALALAPESLFVQDTVDAGVGAVRALYRSRGFAAPQIRATTTVDASTADDADRQMTVDVTVVEGPRTLVGEVAFVGANVLSEVRLRQLVTTASGRPYTDGEVASDRDRLDIEYRNRGYDAVVVLPRVVRRDSDTVADVTFAITEGPQAIVDHVIVVGNRRTSTATITQELAVRSGQPLGSAALVESQQRLAALGLFRRIQITPIAHPGESRRDVVVLVEEARPTTVGYGGGVEGGLRLRPTGEGGQAEERFEVAPRGFFEIGRRNLWGKNRAVNLFGRVSLRSRDVVSPDGQLLPTSEQGGYGFNEYRLYATFREPRVAGTPADLLITGIINQAVRSSFNFITRETRAEAGARLSPGVSIAGRYSFEQTRLFDEHISAEEKPLIDRLFPQVRLSGFAGSLIRDTRDDALYPNRGTFTVVDGEVAARGLGSEVGYVKTFAQTSAYIPVRTGRRVILALAARLGVARGFSRVVDVVDADGVPVAGQEVVQDLPASKRFFAGGDTTVRGFSLDRLGDAKTISPTGFPTGGNGEVIFNSELRVGVLNDRAEVVGFMDAGNVFQRATDLDITNLRGAAGFGFRYRSPVGPIRVDLGFNLKRRELVAGQLERAYVLHISLGQAF